MTLRNAKEIQRAHDLIIPILLEEVPNPFDNPDSKEALHAAADVLCWVLMHDHNTAFGENLKELEEGLADLGIHLEDHSN